MDETRNGWWDGRTTRRTLLRQAGVAAGALAAGTLVRPRVARAQPPVVRIGTLLDYTGPLAEFGPALRRAADLAAAQLNEAARDVLGGPIIELIHEDSGTSAAVGMDRARKLVETDGVPAIVGSLASGVTVPVAEGVTSPARVVMISPASTSPLLTVLPDNDYLFRTIASDALQGVVAAQLAAGELVDGYSFRTASTIYVNNPYGQGLSEAFAQAFQRRGGRVLAQVPHPEEPQPTYTAELDRALAGEPDVLVAISYPGQATVYLQESRDLFGFTRWQFVDGTKSEELISAVGADVLEGQYGTAPGSDADWQGFRRFVQAYEGAYRERPPFPFMDATYDAVVTIGLAVARGIADGLSAGAIDGTAIRDRLRNVSNPPGERVGVGDYRRALELIKGGMDIDYSGAAGEVDFDENGDVVTPVEIWRYRNGAIETVAIRRADQVPTA